MIDADPAGVIPLQQPITPPAREIQSMRERNQPTYRSWWAWAVCGLALAALPLAAQAAELKDARIGAHEGVTRIVFELDSLPKYSIRRLELPGGRQQVEIRFDAETTHRVMAVSSPFVGTVRVRKDQGAGGALARIDLLHSELNVSESALDKPPRIVIDVFPKGGTLPAWAHLPKSHALTMVESVSEPEVTLPALAEEELNRPLAEQTVSSEETTEPSESEATEGETTAGTEAAEVAEPPGTFGEEAGEDEGFGDATESTEAPAEELGATDAQEKESAARDVAAPSGETSAQGPLGFPLSGRVVAVGVLVVALFFIWLRAARRTRQRRSLFSEVSSRSEAIDLSLPLKESEEEIQHAEFVGEKFSSEEEEFLQNLESEPEVVAEEPRIADVGIKTGSSLLEEAAILPERERESFFSPDGMESRSPERSEPRAAMGFGSESGDRSAVEQRIRELEQKLSSCAARLEQAESRLAEVNAERARLQQQLLSHTDELRVQRAAIARTQRAVRRLLRPGEAGDAFASGITPPGGE